MNDKLTASEALYGFAGWLTCRKETVIASSSHDAAIWADLVKTFCDENNLEEPREGWQNNLVHPSGKYSGVSV